MKKVLLIIGLALIMVGCNNPLKKSVTKELTTEELKTISDKDPRFLKFYEEYFETPCYQRFLSVKSDQVEYTDITYKELYNYYLQINDENYVRSIEEEAENEWNEKFGYTEAKFDSIIAYWQDYYATNSMSTYVDIQFDHASLAYNWSDSNVALFFKITPKKDAFIHGLVFDFTIRTKGDESKVLLSERMVSCYKDFQTPIVIDNNHYFLEKDDLYNDLIKDKLTYEELINKYDFEYDIDYVKTENEGRIDFDALFKEEPEIGSYIRWFDSNSREKDNVWKTGVIRKHINNEYEDPVFYKRLYYGEKIHSMNPACFNFLNYLEYCK